MKLRKTLAGILGAVVMLLGVGTFEHVNKETGVHAATENSSITFSELGLSNGSDYSECSLGHVTVTFDKGSNSNATKYYTSGSALRAYGGNTITFNAGDYKITQITFTFGNSDGSNGITADVGNFNSPTWTGEESNIVFTIGGTSGNRRISALSVIYDTGDVIAPLTIPNVKIDAYTGEASWDAIDNVVKYEYIIDEVTVVETTETSVVLTDGQSIKVKAIADGTNYLDSEYSELFTYNAIPVTETVQSWIESYYNEGVYTKKSEINLNETSEYFELADVIHHDEKQPVSLDRTTYYNGEALFMSNLDGSIGGEGQINSGYRTEGSDLRHFTLNEENEAVNDWKVSNTTLKDFFVTLDKFNESGYFDNWKLSATEATFTIDASNKNSDTVKEFVAFVAPCLDNIFESEYSNYFQLDKFAISQSENYYDKPYLSLKIYIDSTCSGTLVEGSNLVLAESRIYAGNEVFDEDARNVKINAPAEGGSITCDVDISKPVKIGTVLTFTITVDDDYALTALKINSSDKLNDALEDNQVVWTVQADVTVSLGFTSTLVTDDIIFEFGTNGASHSDGSEASSYSETVGNYTLTLEYMSKIYKNAKDSAGNSCLKLGTASAAGTFTFAVSDDVNKVIINVAGYKTNEAKLTINDQSYTVSTLSNEGEYTAIEIDTSSTKTVTLATVSGGYRCMINSIQFITD